MDNQSDISHRTDIFVCLLRTHENNIHNMQNQLVHIWLYTQYTRLEIVSFFGKPKGSHNGKAKIFRLCPHIQGIPG